MPIRIVTSDSGTECVVTCAECQWDGGPYPYTMGGLIKASGELEFHHCVTTVHRDLLRQLMAERFGTRP